MKKPSFETVIGGVKVKIKGSEDFVSRILREMRQVFGREIEGGDDNG